MRLLYVPLRRETLDTLVQDAQQEHRRPQDHAAFLLEQSLKHRPKSSPQQSETREARK